MENNQEIIATKADSAKPVNETDLVLAKGESVVKCYRYASVKTKKDNIDSSLTITNMRVVSQSKGKRFFDRTEIPIQAVYSIDSYYAKSTKKWANIIISFLISAITAVIAFMTNTYLLLAVAFIFLMPGIVLILQKRELVVMIIYTDKYLDDIMSISINSISKNKKKKKSKNKIKVRITSEGLEMLNTFGAQILDLKKSLVSRVNEV